MKENWRDRYGNSGVKEAVAFCFLKFDHPYTLLGIYGIKIQFV